MAGIRFNQEELATVLVALRSWQQEIKDKSPFSIHRNWPDHFTTNSGRPIRPLDGADIDKLCERINGGE